jgi:hypothetical protein
VLVFVTRDRAANWPSVQGRIVTVQRSGPDANRYLVRFRYRVAGTQYEAEQRFVTPADGDEMYHAEIHYRPGTYIDVFHDRADPSIALIHPTRTPLVRALSAAGLMMLAGGLSGLVSAWFVGRYRDSRELRRMYSGKCRACGYRLQGLPICPECGADAPPPSAP